MTIRDKESTKLEKWVTFPFPCSTPFSGKFLKPILFHRICYSAHFLWGEFNKNIPPSPVYLDPDTPGKEFLMPECLSRDEDDAMIFQRTALLKYTSKKNRKEYFYDSQMQLSYDKKQTLKITTLQLFWTNMTAE